MTRLNKIQLWFVLVSFCSEDYFYRNSVALNWNHLNKVWLYIDSELKEKKQTINKQKTKIKQCLVWKHNEFPLKKLFKKKKLRQFFSELNLYFIDFFLFKSMVFLNSAGLFYKKNKRPLFSRISLLFMQTLSPLRVNRIHFSSLNTN